MLWCAGTQARPAATWLGVDAARNGAVKVRPDCSVPGYPEIFAIGDVASLAGPDGRPLPGLAAVATQLRQKYVAGVIDRRVASRPAPSPFRYRNLGTLAVIGRSRAVADLGRIHLRGFPAWLFWSLVHLFLLAGFRNRLHRLCELVLGTGSPTAGVRGGLIVGVPPRSEIEKPTCNEI